METLRVRRHHKKIPISVIENFRRAFLPFESVETGSGRKKFSFTKKSEKTERSKIYLQNCKNINIHTYVSQIHDTSVFRLCRLYLSLYEWRSKMAAESGASKFCQKKWSKPETIRFVKQYFNLVSFLQVYLSFC